jgi:deoxyhypusine synthase
MVDFKKIKTYSLKDRANKFYIKDIIPIEKAKVLSKNKDLEKLANEIKKAKESNKQIILMMGAHLIKLGLSDYIIDLMKKGYITHIAMNGAGPIHDFELAYIGGTSEDVAKSIEDGSFGMAYETGHYLNKAAKNASIKNLGFGYEIGFMIKKLNLKYKEHSILYNAFKLKIPVTVHTAIGTEIIYQHPECNGGALGKASYNDFKRLTDSVSKLEEGVIINLGSSVILPEVFLKSLTIARNLGYKINNFSAANLDMINHYRPRVNVIERPTSLGGKKYFIKEMHEKSIPTLYYYITKKIK